MGKVIFALGRRLVRTLLGWSLVLTGLGLHAQAQSDPTNFITIREKAGVTTNQYPIQLGRPFVPGEIPNFPQAVVDGTPVTTQADVKARWADGSVKHAILSFYLPSLVANSTATVNFVNQTSGNNTGALSKNAMLGTAFDFEAAMQLTSGTTTLNASALID